jgi:hypothetical protein
MSAPARPKPPDDLQAAGKRLWRDVTGVYVLTATEVALLHEAGRTADECDRIVAALNGDPVTVPGSRGQDTANPLLAEARRHRVVLAGLVSALALPDVDTPTGRRQSPASKRAQHAAEARWSRVIGARGRRGAPSA